MSNIINVRELARYSFSENDYAFVMDKRSNTLKGLLVSPVYAENVKKYLDELKEKKARAKIDRYSKYLGKFSGETENKSSKEIRASKK